MTRRASTFELALPARPAGIPASHWLRNSLRVEILSGQLQPGARLPASRDLARQYRLSRGTIVAAMDELQAEGYLEARRGSGTYISKILPERLLQPQKTRAKQEIAPSRTRPSISAYGARVRPFSHYVHPDSVAFRTNLPALDLFPTTLWAQVASRRLRKASTGMLLGCGAQGYKPLREAVAQYARISRGVNCEDSQVVIVSGIREALDLTIRLLLDPGDKVLMEDPGYQGAYAAFRAAGATLVSAPIDAHGAAPREMDFRKCRLLYLTPGHQYPLGTTMSLNRRLCLLTWARKYGTTIFEDDYDSEFRYSGRPIPALQGLDREGVVIFAGTFNKVLFPSLRLGYMVLPPSLVNVFDSAKAMTTGHHPLFDQAVLCDFIEQGHFGRHIRRMRKIYEERFSILQQCAREQLGDYLDFSPLEAGLQTTALLRNNISAKAVAREAAARNIDVVPLQRYCYSAVVPQGLQIGFAAVDEKQIRAGVTELAGVLEQLCSGDSPAGRRNM